MSNPVNQWSTGYNCDLSIFTFYGNYMYFPNTNTNYIIQTNLDGSIKNSQWASTGSSCRSCIVYNNALYLANLGSNTISKIIINNDGSAGANTIFVNTNLNQPIAFAITTLNSIDFLFVVNISGKISKISLTSNHTQDNYNWVTTGLNAPIGVCIFGDYLYVATNGDAKIHQIKLSDPTVRNDSWAGSTQGVSYPITLVVFNGYVYVSNNAGNQYVNKISLTNPSTDYVSNFITGVSQPVGMAIDENNYLYILSTSGGTIYKMNNSLLDNLYWSTNRNNNVYYFIAFYDDYLYFQNSNVISRTNLDGVIVDNNWVTLNDPEYGGANSCVGYNGYLYVSSYNTITRILISDKSITYNWASLDGSSGGRKIITDGTYLYVACFFSGYISRILISNPSSKSLYFKETPGALFVTFTKNSNLEVTPSNLYYTGDYGILAIGSYLYKGNSNGTITKTSISDSSVVFGWKTNLNNPIRDVVYYDDYFYVYTPNNTTISKFYLPEIRDDPVWSATTFYNANVGYVAFYGNYIYYPDLFNNRIIRLNLNGTIDTLNWVSTNRPQAAIVYNGYLYVTDSYQTNVRKILLSNPAISTTINIGAYSPQGLAQDDNYIYVAIYSDGTITRISKVDDSFINNWATGLNEPFGVCIDNGYLYVSNAGNNRISKILLSNPSIAINNWASAISAAGYLNYPVGIVTNNGYLYVSSWVGNTISKITLSDPSIYVSDWKTSYDGLSRPGGLTFNETYIYTPISGTSPQSIGRFYLEQPPTPPVVIPPPPCFKKDTKILTDKGYIPVQYLRKGDLVKTLKNEYKAIHMIGKKLLTHDASQERNKKQLFVYRREQYPEIIEDLVITGCHSILVDRFSSDKQREKTIETNGDIYVTDKKYRLPAVADEKAVIFEASGEYLIYHIALENQDYYMNYGIYANGLLVETCSKRYLKECSEMTLIGL